MKKCLNDIAEFKLNEANRLPLMRYINHNLEIIKLTKNTIDIMINEKTADDNFELVDILVDFCKILKYNNNYAIEQYYKYLNGEDHDNNFVTKEILCFNPKVQTFFMLKP